MCRAQGECKAGWRRREGYGTWVITTVLGATSSLGWQNQGCSFTCSIRMRCAGSFSSIFCNKSSSGPGSPGSYLISCNPERAAQRWCQVHERAARSAPVVPRMPLSLTPLVPQSEAEVPPPSALPGKGRRAGRQARREGTWREPWGSETCWRIMSYSCSTLAQMKGLPPPPRPPLSVPPRVSLSVSPSFSLAPSVPLYWLSRLSLTLPCTHMHRTLHARTHRHGPNLAKYAITLNKHESLLLPANFADQRGPWPQAEGRRPVDRRP
jgi:hypothetical protein